LQKIEKQKGMTVRVRFAPSPTGPLHIGGLRTALFNYLFARKHGGTFILRIEDTDQTRFIPGAEEYIIESFRWCGIQIDEGQTVGGPHAPYRQSERAEIYRNYAQQLIDSGWGYYAFDTPEELEELRQKAEAEGKAFTYDSTTRIGLRNSLTLDYQQVEQLIASGTPYVIRFKIPENREIEMNDIIRGDIKVNSSTLDDKVLFKSDGLPTYHLANVVDDHLMEITHVIRGEEWLPSLPLHVLLYEAFGWLDTMPRFAHLPLILKPEGKGKLSKRDGDKAGFPVFPLRWISPEGEVSRGYREDGYLPQAVVNLLALLGWNPGTEQEIFSLQELSQLFDLDRVSKSGARFDPEKARWFNHQHLQICDKNLLVVEFIRQLKERNISAHSDYIARVIDLIRDRLYYTHDLWEQGNFFFIRPTEFEEKAVKKRWKAELVEPLRNIGSIITQTNPYSAESLKAAVSNYIEQHGLGFGAIANAMRIALVGDAKGPDLFAIIELLGAAETAARIEFAIETIKV